MNRWRQVRWTPPSQDAGVKSSQLLCTGQDVLNKLRDAKSQFPHSCSALVKLCSPITFSEWLLLLQTLGWTWPLLRGLGRKCVISAGRERGSCSFADSASLLAGVWGFQTFWFLSCEAVLKKLTSSRIHFFQRLVSQRNLRILRNL